MARYGRLNARDPLVCYRIFRSEEDEEASPQITQTMGQDGKVRR